MTRYSEWKEAGKNLYSEFSLKSSAVISVIHAEKNAIGDLDVHGCTLYTTHLPCAACARLTVSKSIKRVVFVKGNLNGPLHEVLRTAEVSCERVPWELLQTALEHDEAYRALRSKAKYSTLISLRLFASAIAKKRKRRMSERSPQHT